MLLLLIINSNKNLHTITFTPILQYFEMIWLTHYLKYEINLQKPNYYWEH